VQAAKDEGVVFEWLLAPVRFLDGGAGAVRAIEVQRMELGAPDADGRRKPVPVEGSNFEIQADLVILAFGFDGSPVPTRDGPNVTKWGTYEVNEDAMTSVPGIFAGGDVVRGADLVTTALADGRIAAAAIERYLAEQS
jgi:glutamate synthase (NADPH/NADH) small chain